MIGNKTSRFKKHHCQNDDNINFKSEIFVFVHVMGTIIILISHVIWYSVIW